MMININHTFNVVDMTIDHVHHMDENYEEKAFNLPPVLKLKEEIENVLDS